MPIPSKIENLEMEAVDTIRPVTADDKATILRMMETFNQEELIPYSPERLGESFDTLLANPQWGQVLLAELGGVPVGYGILTYGFDFEFGGRDAFMTELFVVPRHRGKAIGGALIAAIETFARENGVKAIHLIVRRENPNAQRLYRRNDFQFDPRILMTKPLK